MWHLTREALDNVNAEEAGRPESRTDTVEIQSSRTTEARGEIIHFTERDRLCGEVGEEGDTAARKASEDANPAASDGSRHATAECWINSL